MDEGRSYTPGQATHINTHKSGADHIRLEGVGGYGVWNVGVSLGLPHAKNGTSPDS